MAHGGAGRLPGSSDSQGNDGWNAPWKEWKYESREEMLLARGEKLCRSWSATGGCAYGNRCMYLHGRDDRRHKTKSLSILRTLGCLRDA